MRIWLDTEFNEFRGDLISMGLVAEDGHEWYRVLDCPNPGPWVAEHVMPILKDRPVPMGMFQAELQHWLSRYPAVHIVADWPEDIAFFCKVLICGPGVRLNTPPLTLEIRRDLDGIPSDLPHNALHDARALMASHLELEYRLPSTVSGTRNG